MGKHRKYRFRPFCKKRKPNKKRGLDDSITIDIYNTSLTSATRYYYVENESDLPADNGNYWHYDENGNIAVW